MNPLRKIMTLALLVGASVVHAGDFGVQVEVDLPADPASIVSFTFTDYDILAVRAFYESGPWGLRFDLQTATEVQLGVYRRLTAVDLGLIGYETTVGAYAGYNWRGDAWFVRFRGRVILYGSIPP